MLVLLLTLFVVQRDTYKAVTVPVLIDCEPEERDGNASFLPGLQGLRPIRILREKDFKGTSKFLRSIGTREMEEFLAVAELLNAVKKQDRLAATHASARLLNSESPELGTIAMKVAKAFKSYPQTKLDEVISERLMRARLVVWNFQDKPVLALYCPDNLTALFTNALLSRVSGRGLAVCPQCGLPFVQKRPNQDYCSIKHREAHRVARWRASKTLKGRKGDK